MSTPEISRRVVAGQWETVVADSGGSGAAFNGGTITESLVVANADPTGVPILAQAAPGQTTVDVDGDLFVVAASDGATAVSARTVPS